MRLATTPGTREYSGAATERIGHKPTAGRVHLPGEAEARAARVRHLARRHGAAACAATAAGLEARGLVGPASLWHEAALAGCGKAVRA